ncbi:MAG: protein-lysine N-methyltransferase [Deltaproteobacteria bacterium]|nr:protein-lysine N-methyltransferase [Deltaproteobacteria bacterium]
MPPLDGLRVVLSKIHGYGVITTRPFAQGEVVCFGDGVLYTPNDEFDDTYSLILSGEGSGIHDTLFWDLACQTRWFNHSCDPNTDVNTRWDSEANTVRAWWVCLRDIPEGEEITYDYGFAAEVAEPCACGADLCRGVIVDEDPAEQAKLSERLRQLLRGTERAAS